MECHILITAVPLSFSITNSIMKVSQILNLDLFEF